ncbi:MAG: DUF2341 domain-containing protein [Acidobacteriota bacterium]
MHRVAVAVCCATAVSACGRIGFDVQDGTGGGSGGWRKPLAFHPTGLTGDVPGFPAAIVIAADPDLAANAQPDASDLHITAGDGVTALPMEIESWAPATGALVAWTRLPVLSAGETDAYLYYGGPSAGDRNASGVWSDYAAVWHFAGDPASGRFLSSAAPSLLGTAAGSTIPAAAQGVAGPALSYDGIDDTINIGDPSDGSLDFGSTSFSYSAWVFVTTSKGPFDMVWYKGGANATDSGYDMELGTANWSACVSDGGRVACASFTAVDGGLYGHWAHLVAVVDRGAQMFYAYADGSQREAAALPLIGDLSTGTSARIGQDVNLFEGRVDEVRVAKLALAPDRIVAENENLVDPSFLVIGPAQPAP